jgi:hypothetical protein
VTNFDEDNINPRGDACSAERRLRRLVMAEPVGAEDRQRLDLIHDTNTELLSATA